MSSGVNDEPVLQEDKSKESIDHSRSVFSTPTIPTGNQVTKSVNKPHYPKSFGNGGVGQQGGFFYYKEETSKPFTKRTF